MSHRQPYRRRYPARAPVWFAVAMAVCASSCGASEGTGAPTRPVEEVVPSRREAPVALEDPALDEVMLKLMRATRKSFAALDVGGYRLVVEGTEERARAVAARTVRPVVTSLSKQFFKKTPRRGVRIVLFSSDDTYRKGAEELTGERPDTPFGFYSSDTSAVIMNLATGGGTLVHEMVHTFTETDFPAMPAWFNGGLASLYEQCRIRPEKLVGLTNWRLPDLQDRLREGDRGLLAKVVATSSDQFYGRGSGSNYAVARYLCYDLQEKGLLERFYKDFRRDHKKDPTGRNTLERILGERLDAYEPGWIRRTLALRFGR
ncbi:MAG: hypothetical protein ACYSU0_07450 [Planctomycetota bacterium]